MLTLFYFQYQISNFQFSKQVPIFMIAQPEYELSQMIVGEGEGEGAGEF